MSDDPLTESKFFHITAIVMGAMLLSILGYFAYTVQNTSILLNGMAHDVASIKENTQQSFTWTAKRLDGHDSAIKDLDGRLRTVEMRHK